MLRQHIGIYGYRRDFLAKLSSLPPSPLEQIEKLEQLRFLQAGHAIIVGTISHASRGIDTRQDYDEFVGRLAKVSLSGATDGLSSLEANKS